MIPTKNMVYIFSTGEPSSVNTLVECYLLLAPVADYIFSPKMPLCVIFLTGLG